MGNKININIELNLFNSTCDLNYETQNLMKIAHYKSDQNSNYSNMYGLFGLLAYQKFGTCYEVEKSIILTPKVRKPVKSVTSGKIPLLLAFIRPLFYTLLHLASLGTAWYKIKASLQPKRDKNFPSENRSHFFLTMLVGKIQFVTLLNNFEWSSEVRILERRGNRAGQID